MDINKYVINRCDRLSRLNHTIKQLNKVDLSDMVVRVNADSPEKLNLMNESYKYCSKKAFNNICNPNSTIVIPTLKSLACTITHQKIWKHIIDNDAKFGLIIEDDIEINDTFTFKQNYEVVLNIIKTIDKNNPFYIVFNGNYQEINSNEFDNINVSSLNSFISDLNSYSNNYANTLENTGYINNSNYLNHVNIKRFPVSSNITITGTHFYIINNKMASFLLENTKYCNYQIDIEISFLAKKNWYNYNINHPIFLNIEDNCIKQSSKFKSDCQLYVITKKELSNVLNFNEDISENILSFIPFCLKTI